MSARVLRQRLKARALPFQSAEREESLVRPVFWDAEDREFTKGGLVKGGLASYVLKTSQIAKPPFTNPPFVNSRILIYLYTHSI